LFVTRLTLCKVWQQQITTHTYKHIAVSDNNIQKRPKLSISF